MPKLVCSKFVYQCWKLSVFTPDKDHTKNVYVRSVSERALLNPGYITNFTTMNGVKTCRQDCSEQMY